ncbi:MAG TPA: acyl carrier protein [Patescibacteria group bacterium]|nr:acyl carrier protein [Patescibacteria group bacterium]
MAVTTLQLSPEIFGKVAHTLSEITGNELSDIGPYTDFSADLSMSPMEMAQLVAKIEEMYRIQIGRSDLGDMETVSDLVIFIEEALS